MGRQSTSKRMFGLVIIAITLLLVACGNGDGDADPTATSSASEAAPTLPANDGTAEVEATEDISEDDLTVVEPEIAASAEATQVAPEPSISPEAESTPADEAIGSPPAESSPESAPTDLTGAEATPTSMTSTSEQANEEIASGTPNVSTPVSSPGAGAEVSPATAELAAPGEEGVESTPAVVASPEATSGSAPVNGHYNNPGDGTGGSGQPGERSSNVPGDDVVVASPIAGIAVDGCEVLNVPAFEEAVVDYITNAEVNFRSGPGTECAAILEEPIAPDVTVVVIGGPVTQSSDNTIWLQVELDGVPGWVSQEFVEPAP